MLYAIYNVIQELTVATMVQTTQIAAKMEDQDLIVAQTAEAVSNLFNSNLFNDF